MKKIILIILLMTTFILGHGKLLYVIDFTKQKDGDARAWLKSKGYKFLVDSKKVSLYFSNGKHVR